jgi:hypothetical protein
MARAFVNDLHLSSACFPLLSEMVECEHLVQPALTWFSSDTATVAKEIAVDFATQCMLPFMLLR